jgi:hypothetical protein
LDFQEYFAIAMEELKTQYNWYNLAVYVPIRFNGNLVAGYE